VTWWKVCATSTGGEFSGDGQRKGRRTGRPFGLTGSMDAVQG
jgi:hypothetical protein